MLINYTNSPSIIDACTKARWRLWDIHRCKTKLHWNPNDQLHWNPRKETFLCKAKSKGDKAEARLFPAREKSLQTAVIHMLIQKHSIALIYLNHISIFAEPYGRSGSNWSEATSNGAMRKNGEACNQLKLSPLR